MTIYHILVVILYPLLFDIERIPVFGTVQKFTILRFRVPGTLLLSGANTECNVNKLTLNGEL